MLEPWQCATCGKIHEGVFDLGMPAPWHWQREPLSEPNAQLRMDGDFLSADLCVVGGRDFFVRGVLEIPLRDSDEVFGLGCWSSLSRANFERYVESFNGAEPDTREAWTGWFSTWMKPFPSSINEPCWVQPRGNGLRPSIWLEGGCHPLAQAQREGITTERLLEIYRANGHGTG